MCDALLDQGLFAGVGNIIRNEVLFRIRVHPLSTMAGLPAARLRELVREARQYSFDFFEWKKAYVLRKHWLAHTKRTCPRCQIPFSQAHPGNTMRRVFIARTARCCILENSPGRQPMVQNDAHAPCASALPTRLRQPHKVRHVRHLGR